LEWFSAHEEVWMSFLAQLNSCMPLASIVTVSGLRGEDRVFGASQQAVILPAFILIPAMKQRPAPLAKAGGVYNGLMDIFLCTAYGIDKAAPEGKIRGNRR
jgi:hypothetical protein